MMPFAWSIPHVGFVVIHAVFLEELAEFVLKGMDAVMLLLIVNVGAEGIQIVWADGEAGVAALPGEILSAGGLGLHPFGGRGFQSFDEVGDGEGAGESDGEVDVIGHAADTITFATGIASDGREVGVQVGADIRLDESVTVLGAKDDVDDDQPQ